ncbi:MAG: hypothetical protein IPM48_04200 [Saprospiraceae bacterium]|nr:hypothetical protein [Saprospiraceae bacterium]
MIEFVVIRRSYEEKQVLGTLLIMDEVKTLFNCRTLELAWQRNQKNISCVPAGKYMMKFEYSSKFKRKLWELKAVPNRTEIKFHVANFHHELNGCIAVGDLHLDMNQDGFRDLRNSRNTLDKIHQYTNGLEEVPLWIYGDGRDKI